MRKWCDLRLCSGDLKVAFFEFEASSKEGASQDKQKIGEDGAQHLRSRELELLL